jgi:hypothetical protein
MQKVCFRALQDGNSTYDGYLVQRVVEKRDDAQALLKKEPPREMGVLFRARGVG